MGGKISIDFRIDEPWMGEKNKKFTELLHNKTSVCAVF